MKLLKEIKDKELPKDQGNLRIRESSRAVLFDEKGLVPLLWVSKQNYHKLPGGGIKEEEDQITALKRECLEEVGCKIEITGEVGRIEEFREKLSLKQTSFCYLGKVIAKGAPTFTDKELRLGFKVVWASLEEAISMIKKDKPEGYEGALFIQERDLAFLEEVKSLNEK